MYTFDQLASKIRGQNNLKPFTTRLLSIDPGETTGIAMFKGTKLYDSMQLTTKDVNDFTANLIVLFDDFKPCIVVIENYRIYSWKADQHKWADLHTPRVIGSTEALCYMRQIPLFKQMAQQTKQFCTDKKLKDWKFYQKGQPHTRDAIRHGCYFILFNKYRSKKL